MRCTQQSTYTTDHLYRASTLRKYLRLLIGIGLFIGLIPSPSVAQDSLSARSKSTPPTIPDTLLFKIQRAQSIITDIKAADKKGYGTIRIRAGLTNIKANVTPIAFDIRTHIRTIDTKNLSNYTLILSDALNKLTTWRTSLSRSNNDLQNRLDAVLNLSSDSLLTVAGNDTTEKKFYADQLSSLKHQLQMAGTHTSAQLDTVSRLLADVSGTYLTISDLQATINDRVQTSNATAFQKETPYLWEAPTSLSLGNLQTLLKASYQGQDKVLNYFFASTWDNRFLLLLLIILFFAWVATNFQKARKPPLSDKLGALRFDNLTPIPVVPSLIVLLNLAPLFEPESPGIYIEITQFLLLVVLSIHLWKRFSRQDLLMWLLNATLYVLLIITDALVTDSLFMRIWLIVLNAGFIYIGIFFAQRLGRRYLTERIIRTVLKLHLVLQVLAILLNLIGRISLAKTFGLTAVIGLIQITGLGVFIEIVLEALELQIKISSSSEGVFSRVNIDRTRQSFKNGLAFVSIGIWLLVFVINLGVADSIYTFFDHILTRPRTFGSLTFSLSNILLFGIIIYLSSVLQKNIGLLFGETQVPGAGTTGQVNQISSVLALTRLVIVIAGLLLAVTASGISLDKLTVVLGALSVGIGLGMQNIVSNFVSGVILIFEKPFQIGDYIELADKKGRIRDIGIRSSKMVTVQGSEVVIPNSDLLSNRLVNWTSTDTYLKTEFTVKVRQDTDVPTVTELIKAEVSKLDGALPNMPPEILVTGIGADNVELTIRVWIRSIYTEASTKSQLLQQLIARFKEANIALV